jgi:site-specific recombinase XerD
MGQFITPVLHDNYNKELSASLIDARTDAEAIATFLTEFKESPNTFRSYSKEVERLLLWCIHIGNVNIASLRRDHLLNYQSFLKAPTPKKYWCGPAVNRQTKDGSINARWRPFVKGLSPASVNKALKILDSFFNYLVQTHYLVGNPLAVDRRRKKRNQSTPRLIDRYLEMDEIITTLNALAKYPTQKKDAEKFRVVRARYIILLLFYTGLRISEAAHHSMGHFLQRRGNWFLRVIGKGKKLREIPIPDALLTALKAFRGAIDLSPPLPKFREKTPLIPMQNLVDPINTRRINQIVRWAFNLGAVEYNLTEPRKASKLRAASPHWLRHSYVTYLLESGAPLKVVQENAGHSDVGTTMHYRHVAQLDRHSATRALILTTTDEKDNH